MANTIIKFGTSGWRARIAEDFNVDNIRRAAHATAMHIKENKIYGFNGEEYKIHIENRNQKMPKSPIVIIGYDTRFYSENAAKIVAEVFAYYGIVSYLSDIEAPTPTIAWLVLKHNAIGGITITASHNPPNYNGYKWTPFWGGPAIAEITNDIELKASQISIANVEKRMNFEEAKKSNLVKIMDFHKDYFEQIIKIIDFKTIHKSNIKIAIDNVHGASKTYIKPLLEKHGIKPITLREYRDVYFGGHSPDTDEENLSILKDTVLKNKLNLGIATDGDADRYGIIDSNGEWMSPNLILGLATYHLVKNRKLKGKIVRSVMTSHFVDSVAKLYGLEVRETPVGFKYIGNLLKTGQYLIGGEESAGLSIINHVPEKDGILACLLIAELVACERKPLIKILNEIQKQTGVFYNKRVNFKISDDIDINSIIDKLSTNPPLNIASSPVWRIDNTDGFKFIMKDGSWLGLRASGTEPVFRIYVEAKDLKKMEQLLEAGKKIAIGKF